MRVPADGRGKFTGSKFAGHSNTFLKRQLIFKVCEVHLTAKAERKESGERTSHRRKSAFVKLKMNE